MPERVKFAELVQIAFLRRDRHQRTQGRQQDRLAQLVAIEPALSEAQAFTVSGNATNWEASALSGSGTTFTIRFDGTNQYERDCDRPGHGLCNDPADANGNRW